MYEQFPFHYNLQCLDSNQLYLETTLQYFDNQILRATCSDSIHLLTGNKYSQPPFWHTKIGQDTNI